MVSEVPGVVSLVEAMLPPGTPMPPQIQALVSRMKRSEQAMRLVRAGYGSPSAFARASMASPSRLPSALPSSLSCW